MLATQAKTESDLSDFSKLTTSPRGDLHKLPTADVSRSASRHKEIPIPSHSSYQWSISAGNNHGLMHKDIILWRVRRCDEAVALFIAEPFDGSSLALSCHG